MESSSVKKTIQQKRREGQEKFNKFLELYRKAHPELKNSTQYDRANEEYPKLKNDENLMNERIAELKLKIQNSLSSSMSKFASMFAKQKAKADVIQPTTSTSTVIKIPASDSMEDSSKSSENIEQNDGKI